MRKRNRTANVTTQIWLTVVLTVTMQPTARVNGQEADSPDADKAVSIVLTAPEIEQPNAAVDESQRPTLEESIPTDQAAPTETDKPDSTEADVVADEEVQDVFADASSETPDPAANDVTDNTVVDSVDATGEDETLAELPQPPAAPTSDSNTATVADDVPEGVEPLLRGPVHEAFAEPLQLNVAASPVVPKTPPEPVEELPPEIDANSGAIWISGYWAWDEDRSDFIWVSGVWRKQPNGRTWTPGKWVEVDGGVQWVAGFWTNAVNTNKVQVLPAPPETLEQGPTVAQPSEDHFWIPGSWQYRNSRYAWRPGFWSPCQQNWVWVPEHYRWHPQGCIHVAGYWDYHWSNRGTLFAPTYFSSNIYRTAGYRYRPSVVVSLGSAFDHLWIRPGYSHYFIGDYYSNYNQRGYIPWYSYASRTRYYDPLFAYQRWALRHSIHDLHHHYHQRHNHYHRYVDHRPFHTYRDFHHHHRRNSRVNISQPRRNTTTAPPSRLTGSAFVSRVDDIVRQQHRDRHAGKRGSQVVTNRGAQGTRGSSRTNSSVYRGNSNRGQLQRNARNIADIKAVTNAGTKTNQPNVSNKGIRGTKRPNVSTNMRGNGKRPQVKPNSAFVKNNANQNRNQGKGSKPNAQVRRPAPSRTSSPPTRTLVTKPRTTTPNTYVTKPRVTPPNNTRPKVANPRNVVTRPRVTKPNSNSGSNTTNRSAINRNFVTRGTSPSTSQKVRSAVQSSPRPTTQANKTNTRTVQPQRVQPQRVQTPRPNTTSRAQQFSRSRQRPSTSVRSQPRAQTSRSQAFRAPVSRPPTVRQPSVRNVRPNVRSTPQRVTPQRVQPQRSIQRSSPSRNVRPTPRPSVNMNRGAGFSRSRASTPRSTPSRGSSFRGNKR